MDLNPKQSNLNSAEVFQEIYETKKKLIIITPISEKLSTDAEELKTSLSA